MNNKANAISRKSLHGWGVIIGVYSILTILVWGLFALDRGTWQDEVMIFHVIQSKGGSLWAQLFTPIPSPTRIFAGTIFAIAQWSGNPVIFLQFMYGLIWFITGLLSHLFMRSLFPKLPLLAYFAGSLTLCATGDFTTNYLGALSLNMSVALYLSSTVCLLNWWQGKSAKWLWPTGICLYLSIWMYDASLPAIVLVPVLLWAMEGFRFTRRVVFIILFWYTLLAPYLIVFSASLANHHSYISSALLQITLYEKIKRITILFINNFTPWTWALNRRQWFPALTPVLSSGLKIILSLIGTAFFLVVAARLCRDNPSTEKPRKEGRVLVLVGAISLLIAFVSNVAYASVQFSEFYFRSQLVSRIWTSFSISLLAYWVFFFCSGDPIFLWSCPQSLSALEYMAA